MAAAASPVRCTSGDAGSRLRAGLGQGTGAVQGKHTCSSGPRHAILPAAALPIMPRWTANLLGTHTLQLALTTTWGAGSRGVELVGAWRVPFVEVCVFTY